MRALLLAAVLAASSFQVQAQSMCGPSRDVLSDLATEFGEVLVFVGRHPTEPRRLALTHNPESGTWSIVIDDGTTACVTAHGIEGARGAPPGEDA